MINATSCIIYTSISQTNINLLLCKMRNQHTAWLYFSRSERTALYILIGIFIIQIGVRLWIIPEYFPLQTPHWKSLKLIDQSNPKTTQIVNAYLYDSTLEKKVIATPLEINFADSSEFEKLPMIGGFLAQQIVQYRKALGGYCSLTQLLEIKYLKEDVWEKLREKWTCNGIVKKININQCQTEELAMHPYITWTQAQRITRYRDTHGKYGELSDLKTTKAIHDTMWNKIIPYLAVDSLSP